MTAVLVYTEKNLTSGIKENVKRGLMRAGFRVIHFSVMGIEFPDYRKRKGRAQKWVANEEKKQATQAKMMETAARLGARAIITSDSILVEHMSGVTSADAAKGSVYQLNDGLPVIVMANPATQLFGLRYGKWQFHFHFVRAYQWATNRVPGVPKFKYSLAKTVDDVRQLRDHCNSAPLVSIDIETAGKPTIITCIAFTYLLDDGTMDTMVVPFYDWQQKNNWYWSREADEIKIWEYIRDILECPDSFKCFQHGIYDVVHLMTRGLAPVNYLVDSLWLMYSLYVETPRKIDYILSLFNPYHRYWKEESKGDFKDKDVRVPNTRKGMQMYWRYNALDTYNTMLAVLFLLPRVMKTPWALQNYKWAILDQFGPAMAMTMRGLKIDKRRQEFETKRMTEESKVAVKKIEKLVGIKVGVGEAARKNPKLFNPNSDTHLVKLLYDWLGAEKMTKKIKGKTTELNTVEKKLLKSQVIHKHPMYRAVMNAIWDYKEIENNLSKYGTRSRKFLYENTDRFLYQYSVVTDTSRYNSKQHSLWCGTNAQNIPKPQRSIAIADTGMVFFSIDYGQSDNWWVAYGTLDEKYIDRMNNDFDTHCEHAALFFKRPYEEIFKGYKEKAAWVVHSTEGVRQNTKRVSHGANYLMREVTLYETMGHEAVIAAAKVYYEGRIPAKVIEAWDMKSILKFCRLLLDIYYGEYTQMYRYMTVVQPQILERTKGLLTIGGKDGFTRLFFGDPKRDKEVMRQAAAQIGQTGTAMKIRRDLMEAYYFSDFEKMGGRIHLQTHDSISGMVPEDNIHEPLQLLLTIMNSPVTLNERTFRIPVDAEVGYTWDNGMIEYSPNLTLDDIRKAETEFVMKRYGSERFAAWNAW